MGQVDNSKHKSIKVEVEVKTEITIRETIRRVTDQTTGQIVVTEDSTDKTEVNVNVDFSSCLFHMTEVGPDMNKITGEVTLEET